MKNLRDTFCRRGRLAGITGSHVWPVQLFEQGERAAFLVRQHLIGNLYTRISTRPFLSHVEKVSKHAPVWAAACCLLSMASTTHGAWNFIWRVLTVNRMGPR